MPPAARAARADSTEGPRDRSACRPAQVMGLARAVPELRGRALNPMRPQAGPTVFRDLGRRPTSAPFMEALYSFHWWVGPAVAGPLALLAAAVAAVAARS